VGAPQPVGIVPRRQPARAQRRFARTRLAVLRAARLDRPRLAQVLKKQPPFRLETTPAHA